MEVQTVRDRHHTLINIMKQKRVGVLVLNWNGKALLERFMANWVALVPDYAELVLVDNGSTDGSVAYVRLHFPDVQCLEFSHNLGFAEGYNEAVKLLEYEYVVLLNSDTLLSEGWLDQPICLMDESSQIAVVQPKLRAVTQPDSFEYAGAAGGHVDALGYPFCAGRIFDTLEEDKGQYDKERDLMWATGACFIVRRSVYLNCGGLDSRFFAHQEEIDLCWRIRARGGLIKLAPQSVVYHLGGGTLDKQSPQKLYLNFRNNLLMLYKNLPLSYLLIILTIRCLLDGLATIKYFVSGQPTYSRSVIYAWRDAIKMLPRFRADRRENQCRAIVSPLCILSPLSILLNYYLLGRKTYSALKL